MSPAPDRAPSAAREPADEPLRVAIAVDDPALAERLAAALWSAPGLRLVRDGEAADVILTRCPASDGGRELALTRREIDVLTLLAEGASNKEIARRLGISVHTAKFHVASLLDKLDATGRTDAVTHAARLGVLRL